MRRLAILAVLGLMLTSALFSPSPVAAGTPGPWNTGRWGQIVNNSNGTCVLVQGWSSGTEASAYGACHALPERAPIDQLWTPDLISTDGNGTPWYRLRDLNSGLCLIAPSWNGYNLIQYFCQNYSDQEWTFSVNSTRTRLVHRATGNCLVAPSWAPGDVVLAACANYDDQYWNYMAAEWDVEVTNPATNISFYWYKARLRRGSDCGIWISYQLRDLSWSAWRSLGGCTKYRITAAPVPAGQDWAVQAFVRGTDSAVYTQYQYYWDRIDLFSGWYGLGGTTWSPVEVGRNADNRLQLAVRGTDLRIHTNWQTYAGNHANFSGWAAFDSPSYPEGGYAMSDPRMFSSGQGANRTLEVYTEFPNGSTYARYQWPPNCSQPSAGCWGDRWRFVQ